MFLDGFFDGIVLKGFLPITLLMLMGKLVLYKVKWYLPFIIKKCGIFGHRVSGYNSVGNIICL